VQNAQREILEVDRELSRRVTGDVSLLEEKIGNMRIDYVSNCEGCGHRYKRNETKYYSNNLGVVCKKCITEETLYAPKDYL